MKSVGTLAVINVSRRELSVIYIHIHTALAMASPMRPVTGNLRAGYFGNTPTSSWISICKACHSVACKPQILLFFLLVYMGVRGTGMIISTWAKEIRRARDFLGPIEECWSKAEKDSRVVAIRFSEPVEWNRTNSSIWASCSIRTRYELQARASQTMKYRNGKKLMIEPSRKWFE
jgi:hypothetical protein